MQCSVSSDYGTSILNSSEININEHNNITITRNLGIYFLKKNEVDGWSTGLFFVNFQPICCPENNLTVSLLVY